MTGKKSEFPDAAVVDALRTFAILKRKKLYVVSGDPDLKKCCVEGSNLIHALSLSEVISRATVTKKLHDDLLSFAADDIFLKDAVRKQLKATHVRVYGLGRFADHLEVKASVDDVEDFRVLGLNVISRAANRTFTCEIEFEVSLWLALSIEVAGRYEDNDSGAAWAYFSAEVTFEYDPDTDGFCYLAAFVTDCIEIDGAELEALRRFR